AVSSIGTYGRILAVARKVGPVTGHVVGQTDVLIGAAPFPEGFLGVEHELDFRGVRGTHRDQCGQAIQQGCCGFPEPVAPGGHLVLQQVPLTVIGAVESPVGTNGAVGGDIAQRLRYPHVVFQIIIGNLLTIQSRILEQQTGDRGSLARGGGPARLVPRASRVTRVPSSWLRPLNPGTWLSSPLCSAAVMDSGRVSVPVAGMILPGCAARMASTDCVRRQLSSSSSG